MMRWCKIFMITLVVAVFGGIGYTQSHGQDTEYNKAKKSVLGSKIDRMEFPSLTWDLPGVGDEIKRKKLGNGIVVYMYPDNTLPVVGINVVFHGGNLYETPGEDQVASLLGSFLKMGGTRELSYEELTEELEFMSASLNTSIGSETGGVNARCLKEHFPRIAQLVHDVLLEPGFREDKLDLIKKQRKENIFRQKDYPGWISGTLFAAQLYGDHPYGRIPRVSRIDSITREDLVKAYNRYVVPQRMYMAIAGDIDEKETLRMIKNLFGKWKPENVELPSNIAVSPQYQPGFYIYEKDIKQTHVRLGHLGVKRDNPDVDAIRVMNTILGGEAFKSRLTSRIRSDEGLAYSAGSRFGTSSPELSSFFCYAQTRTEKAFRTITIMRETIQELMQQPPSDEELNQAKDTIINSFIHRWTNTRYALDQIMDLEIEGFPEDYYRTFTDRIQNVSAEDVMRVAQKYLHPDKLVVVLVGKQSEMTDIPDDVDLYNITLPPEYME